MENGDGRKGLITRLSIVRYSGEEYSHGMGGNGLSKSSVMVLVDLLDFGRVKVAVE